jgi:uncharacterized protein YkwD
MFGHFFTRRLAPAVLLTAASLFTVVPLTHAAALNSASTAHTSLASVRTILLAAINTDRINHGLTTLKLDKKQSTCSLQHSEQMASQDMLYHNNLTTANCSSHALLAQNVGEATGNPAQAAVTINQLMVNEGPCPQKGCPGAEYEAHGHYVNLLSPTAHHVGIGMVVANGALWLTEDFTS